ncbi:MAG: hypothetical protein COB90_01025 [Hyphomicrobiales bacterium]|nr:MAG: hypothetical protein COB90_01025 [Hyphomicrobiales bacterium]
MQVVQGVLYGQGQRRSAGYSLSHNTGARTFEDNRRMRVNSTRTVNGAVVVPGLSMRADVGKYPKVIEYLYDNKIDHRKAGSSAMGLAHHLNKIMSQIQSW